MNANLSCIARFAALFLLFGVVTLNAAGQTNSEGPKIAAPKAVLHDEPVKFRVAGLKADATYEIRSEWVSRAGTIWRSSAQFKADGEGKIDPAATAPISGSYSGVDPFGFIWSMENTKERQTDPTLFDTDEQSVISISVREGDKSISDRTIVQRYRQIGVSSTEIRGDVTGTFLAPAKTGRAPGVIVLGGSEGGIPRTPASLIASHSFATLALSYFAADEQPQNLERIPIETVDTAVAWLLQRPEVDPNRIYILGLSKGAELALLAASRNPKIKAVVAIAPSSTAFQSLGRGQASASSWTAGGKEVPFAPFVSSEAYNKSRKFADLYSATLDAAKPDSRIAVENIAGPVLLISGREDALWPSTRMANEIAERLVKNRFGHDVTNLVFDDAGHHAGRIPMNPTGDSVRLGGTAAGLCKSQIQAWQEIVKFLVNADKKGAKN